VTLRPKRPEDDEWIVERRNAVHDHLPPSTVEDYRHWERVENIPEKAVNERLIAERDGRRVGWMAIDKMWWTEREGGYHGSITVDPDLWNQGIGTQMYQWLVRRLTDLGAQRVYGNVREDRTAAQSFLENRGFRKTGHADRWSRLEVKTANLEGYTGLEQRLAGEGIRIATLAETGESEEFLRKLHQVLDEAVRDIPSSERFTESPFEMFVEELRHPDMAPERFWIALDGDEPAGLVMMPVQKHEAAWNGFTGVKRAYRGRGIARALKLKAVEWCRDQDLDFIYTANDVNNRRMLAINNSLGYRQLPISEEVVKELGDGSR